MEDEIVSVKDHCAQTVNEAKAEFLRLTEKTRRDSTLKGEALAALRQQLDELKEEVGEKFGEF